MKLFLKLILILCVVIAGIYAATPLWLPYVLARQLPPGWQLEELQSGYPRLADIHIDMLRVKGELGPAGIALTSSDLRFTYQGLKSDIGLVSVDVYLHGAETRSAESLTMDDLSLPVTKLTGKLPQLTIKKLRVALHRTNDLDDVAASPLLLDFEAFDLSPRPDNGFHLASQATIAESLRFKGRLDVDVSPNLASATLRFPSNTDLPPWLVVDIEQEDLPASTTTRIGAILNADLANREWLDSVLAGSTGHVFTRMGGELEIQVDFAGQDLQNIERLSFFSENLQLVSGGGTLNLDADLLAKREGEEIAIVLQTPAKLKYQGEIALIDELLISAIPGLRLTPRSGAVVSAELGSDGKFLFFPGNNPSIRFNGDIEVDLNSSTESLSVLSNGLQIEMEDLNNPASTYAEGLIGIDLKLNAPFSYTSKELQMGADSLSIAADLRSRDGKLVSTGGGTMMQARVTPGTVSVDKVDMTWQELDLLGLTGKLVTHTQGFITELDNEKWTGFDFDMNYTLLGKTDVSGTGTAKFASGPKIPFEFAGNPEDQRWDIKIPPTTIKLTKLRKLLSVAHSELPASIKLTDGYIELQGEVLVADRITAKMLIGGFDMVASMHESTARKASFTLNAGYDNRLWANGPVFIEALDLAGGIDMTNIRFELELESTEYFELKNLYAEVFDGQIQLASLQFLENRVEDTAVDLSHIDLSQLLAYADIDGLAGTGFLDISLPVGSDATGLHIIDGVFGSTGPGRLAYTKEGLAGSNIGLQAMENFQFKDLSGTLNYQSDGAYLMAIRLDGKNPDLYGGHPVVFNLNINGSLPELFEALFITGSFEESILKEIKSR